MRLIIGYEMSVPTGVLAAAAKNARISDCFALVKHHADGGQDTGENADAERNRIHDAVEKRMKADSQQRYETDGKLGVFVADVGGDEPVEQVHEDIAGEQVEGSLIVHAE